MNKMNKKEILNLPTIATSYEFGGIEIKAIEDTAEGTYMYFTTGSVTNNPTCHKCIVKYNNTMEPYVLVGNVRIYLNTLIRTNSVWG